MDFTYHVIYVKNGEQVFENFYQKWLPIPGDVIFIPGGTYRIVGRAFVTVNNPSVKDWPIRVPSDSVTVLLEVSEVLPE